MSKLLSKIDLSAEEQALLRSMVNKGTHAVRKVKRAQILLKLHQGHRQPIIAAETGVSLATVYNLHHRYATGNLEQAISEKRRSGQPRKVTPAVEAAVTRIACSEAPEGTARWTVALINEKVIALGYELNDESIRLILKKVNLNLGSRNNGALVK